MCYFYLKNNKICKDIKYLGSCISLGDETELGDDAAMQMVEWFNDEDNGTSIDKELFFNYVDKQAILKKAHISKDTDFVYFKIPLDHPYGKLNFMFLDDMDVHYFYEVDPHPILDLPIIKGVALQTD